MKSEGLAYWYFRLNGFLISQNYIIHPNHCGSQRTEIDILGVRFPYKAEIINGKKMADEAIFESKNKPYIIIADATISPCKLNDAWIDPAKKNIHDFLRVVGAFEDKDSIIDGIAKKLYEEGFFENDSYCVSLFCVGKLKNPTLHSKYPNVPQITWNGVLKFIYNRFNKYEREKRAHNQWDKDGNQLWECFKRNKHCETNFINEIIDNLDT